MTIPKSYEALAADLASEKIISKTLLGQKEAYMMLADKGGRDLIESKAREAALREELDMVRKAVPNSTRELVSIQQRLAVADQLLQETSKAILRHQAEQPMSKRLSGLLTKARASVDRHLKGAALRPAEGEGS